MSSLGIASTLLGLLSSSDTIFSKNSASPADLLTNTSGFGASLASRLTGLQGQSDISLLNQASAAKTSKTSSALSADGRNLSLFDPESAFRMMSVINRREVTYKAQYAELDQMKEAVSAMGQASQRLSENLGKTPDDESIRNALRAFTNQYNDWIQRFQRSVESGGVLDEVQAGEISLYELEQSIENRFNGAALGLNGLKDLGMTVTPGTHLLSFDETKLDKVLKSDRSAALGTLEQFSANFSRAAELLSSKGNFITNRLDNLDRAIDFIEDNHSALQAEFGLGEVAKPSQQVATALAAYNRIFAS